MACPLLDNMLIIPNAHKTRFTPCLLSCCGPMPARIGPASCTIRNTTGIPPGRSGRIIWRHGCCQSLRKTRFTPCLLSCCGPLPTHIGPASCTIRNTTGIPPVRCVALSGALRMAQNPINSCVDNGKTRLYHTLRTFNLVRLGGLRSLENIEKYSFVFANMIFVFFAQALVIIITGRKTM